MISLDGGKILKFIREKVAGGFEQRLPLSLFTDRFTHDFENVTSGPLSTLLPKIFTKFHKIR